MTPARARLPLPASCDGQHVRARCRTERGHRDADRADHERASRQVIDYTRGWPLLARGGQRAGLREATGRRTRNDRADARRSCGDHGSHRCDDRTRRQDRLRAAHLFVDLAQRQSDRPPQRGVGSDEHGADPEDFDRLCAQQHPKLAFLMPSLHNPTLAIMPSSAAARSPRSPASTMSGSSRIRSTARCLIEQPTPVRRACAGAHLPRRRPVEDGFRRRARRMGRLPRQFRAAYSDRAQDGDRRPSVHARRACRHMVLSGEADTIRAGARRDRRRAKR